MKLLKSTKGFTMVEMVVSMLIVSIILVFATSFLFTGQNLFDNTIKGNSSKLIGDNVINFVSERLKYASDIEVRNNSNVTNAKYQNVFSVNSNGYLGFKNPTFSDENVFGNEFYSKNSIKATVKVLENNCISITVIVFDVDKVSELYSTTNVIKLMNINVSGNSVEIVNSTIGTEIINPIISFNSRESIIDDNPIDETWNESTLHYNGYSYYIWLVKNKIYSYGGKYYKAKLSWLLLAYDHYGIDFPTPKDSGISQFFNEVSKPK